MDLIPILVALLVMAAYAASLRMMAGSSLILVFGYAMFAVGGSGFMYGIVALAFLKVSHEWFTPTPWGMTIGLIMVISVTLLGLITTGVSFLLPRPWGSRA